MLKKISLFLVSVSLTAVTFLSIPSLTHAEGPTYVSGDITTDQTWTIEGSPYIVEGGVTVNSGVTLTIEPGVQVKFDGNYSLQVDGVLNAQGAPDALILFTSNKPAPAAGDWAKILFNGAESSGSTIKFALIEYADHGLETLASSPFISQTTFRNNNSALYLNPPDTVQPFNNNSFFNNVDFNLVLAGGNSDLTINAENNHWGTTNTVEIDAKIYDKKDRARLPSVDYQPYLSGAVAINFGETISASIDAGNEIDVYSFDGQAGDAVVMPWARTSGSGNFDAWVILYDDLGQEIARSTPDDQGELIATLPKDGTYFIWVHDNNYWETGGYQMTLERINNPVDTVPITWGETISSDTVNKTETDVYSFTGQSGDKTVLVWAWTGGHGSFEATVIVYDETGVEIKRVTYGDYGEMNLDLPADGTYYIWIHDNNYSQTGSYELTLERINNPADVRPLNWGNTVFDGIDKKTNIDIFGLNGKAGDKLVLVWARTGGDRDFDAWIILYDDLGQEIARMTPDNQGELMAALPKDGIYYVWIHDNNYWETGSYELTLERINNPVDTVPINPGEILTRAIDNRTQINIYNFIGQSGDEVVLAWWRSYGSEAFDATMILYDVNGVEVKRTTINDQGQMEAQLPIDGTYYLWVRDDNYVEIGGYDLTLERVNNPVDMTPINWGQTKSGNINQTIEIDIYGFLGQRGDNVVIPWARTGGNNSFDAVLTLYDTVGTKLKESSFDNSGEFTAQLPADGTYYIWIHDNDYSQTGSYQMTLERINNPADVTAINWGQTLNSDIINQTETDVHSFTGQTGDKLVLVWARSSGGVNFDAWVILYDDLGQEIARSTPDDQGELIAALPKDGTYFIWVHDNNYWETGGYEMTLERSNNPVDVVAINWGETLSSDTVNKTETDVYTFTGQAADKTVVVWARTGGGPGSADFDATVIVYDPAGTELRRASYNDSGEMNLDLPMAGDYSVWIHDDDYTQTGSYELTLERINNPVDVRPVNWGNTVFDGITRKTEIDIFGIRGEAGDDVVLTYDRSSGGSSFDATMIIYDEAGTEIKRVGFDDQGEMNVELPADGTYFVWVHDNNYWETGSYEMTLVDNLVINVSAVPKFIDSIASETSNLQFELQRDANVRIKMYKAYFPGGNYQREFQFTLINNVEFPKGVNTTPWDGKNPNTGEVMPNSAYVFTIEAASIEGDRQSFYDPAYTPGSVTIQNGQVTPSFFDPYKGEAAQLTYDLVTPAWVTLKTGISGQQTPTRTLLIDQPRDVTDNLELWDGRNDSGQLVGANTYVTYGWTKIVPDNAVVVEPDMALAIENFQANPYVIYPSNGDAVNLTYTLSKDSMVSLVVQSPSGSVIRTLVNAKVRSAGSHQESWDGKDDVGRLVAAEGHYPIKLMVSNLSGCGNDSGGVIMQDNPLIHVKEACKAEPGSTTVTREINVTVFK